MAVAVAAVLAAATVAHPASAAARRDPVRVTRFLGEQRLPHLARLDGTAVGGLSGIDHDPRTGTWYFISDDRWRYNPARFYTGRLDIDRATGQFGGVRLTGVTTLTRADGTPYPGYGKPGSADPESIRFDRWSGRLLWGDEGDRPDDRNPGIPVSQAAVRSMDRQGRHLGAFPLPRGLRLTEAPRGPRRNFGFEGLAVTPRAVTAVTEGPRFEDGPLPTAERGAPVRLTVWSRAGALRGQYAYPLDALPAAPVPPSGDADGGVSELLAVDEFRYLALERSWTQGVGYSARLYEFDLRGATNVLGRRSLAGGPAYRPVAKRLVLDLSRVAPPAQNYESLAWGPRLDDGECTLVVGSDDNFSQEEATRFLAFGATGCR
ncbi:esterase-like activity of phytase family protein [Actinomadura sp. ATCC 31491]|uniref:Esterase-like activity of phytase family protein n=1 Tax=Actinomadura luzonensis TaxID=2805427 RepID=A0ABT0FW14_9ACTN|nr:esterase-like activity of phytase family protein [Actinomadura luzonensis]MCK2216121.1 esterase-like activity of phytase family protein [Actinomadura luzonensis]